MTPQIKNIIMFGGIAVALILVYFFFIKSEPEENLVVIPATFPGGPGAIGPAGSVGLPSSAPNSAVAQDFLTVLLNIKGIKLDSSIFKDPAFISLQDSTIVITPDGDEGRPNPFAPVGSSPVSSNNTSQLSATAPGI